MEKVDGYRDKKIKINGFTAATATAKGDEWSFRLFAVRFGGDIYRFIFAAKNKTAAVDRSFREWISTFRRMSLPESQQVHPLRLKIVTAGANDTVEIAVAPHGDRGPCARPLPRDQRARAA